MPQAAAAVRFTMHSNTHTKQEFDADGSGFITVDEFLNTMHKRWLRQNEAEIDLAEGTPPNPKANPNSLTRAPQPSPSSTQTTTASSRSKKSQRRCNRLCASPSQRRSSAAYARRR